MTKDHGRVGLIPICPVNTKSIHDPMDFSHGKMNASSGNYPTGTGAGCAGGTDR